MEVRIAFTVSPFEQEFIYLLNRARQDPAAYQVERGLSVNLSSITRRQPLAINTQLTAAAEFKSDDLAERDYFTHTSPTGETANQLVRRFGYDLPNQVFVGGQAYRLPAEGNQVESLAGVQSTPAAALQAMIVLSTDVRNRLLGVTEHNQVAKEVGVGYRFHDQSTYKHYWTVLATPSKITEPFLTGVAFVDGNGNTRFEGNEGLGSVTITASGPGGRFSTTTGAAGGWAMAVPAGDYVVTASGGGFSGTSSAPVRVGTQNLAVDFISGSPAAWVNFAWTGVTKPAAPMNVVATAGDAQVTLKWTAPSPNGGAAISNYVIEYRGNGGAWTSFKRVASTENTATVTKLVNGTNYVFRVAAVNSAGTGNFSPESNAVSPRSTPGPITRTTSITGSISTSGEIDTYSVAVAAGKLIRATVSSGNQVLFPWVELRGPDRSLLKGPAAVEASFADLGMYEVNSGTAVIRVKAQGVRTGAYTLNVSVTTPEELVSEVIRLTNVERQKAGLSPLVRSSLLQQAAQAHVQDLANNRFLSHTGSNGSKPQDRIRAVGYKMAWYRDGSQTRGIRLENAACGPMTAADVVQGWMNSSGHRAAIMDVAAKEIGVGFKYDAQKGDTYWVQNFGNPWQPGMPLWF